MCTVEVKIQSCEIKTESEWMLFCEKVEACVVCIGYGLMDWFGVEEGVKAEESVESGVVAGRFL